MHNKGRKNDSKEVMREDGKMRHQERVGAGQRGLGALWGRGSEGAKIVSLTNIPYLVKADVGGERRI